MKFKEYYTKTYAKELANKLNIPEQNFLQHLDTLEEKELLARQDLLAYAIEQELPDFNTAVKRFETILGEPLTENKGMYSKGWWLWPCSRYIERNGTTDVQTSLDFIYELTQRFTGEFALRPLLEKEPTLILQTLLQWAKDESVHVRRCASECLRPRLPWAKKSTLAFEQFEIYSKILSSLAQDPDKFVQKSVANNLNDLYVLSPEHAEQLIENWDRTNNATQWIIKHGQRSLRKK